MQRPPCCWCARQSAHHNAIRAHCFPAALADGVYEWGRWRARSWQRSAPRRRRRGRRGGRQAAASAARSSAQPTPSAERARGCRPSWCARAPARPAQRGTPAGAPSPLLPLQRPRQRRDQGGSAAGGNRRRARQESESAELFSRKSCWRDTWRSLGEGWRVASQVFSLWKTAIQTIEGRHGARAPARGAAGSVRSAGRSRRKRAVVCHSPLPRVSRRRLPGCGDAPVCVRGARSERAARAASRAARARRVQRVADALLPALCAGAERGAEPGVAGVHGGAVHDLAAAPVLLGDLPRLPPAAAAAGLRPARHVPAVRCATGHRVEHQGQGRAC